MLSVYCSGAIVLAWRRFHFVGLWQPVFAFMIVAVLYLNVDSVAIQLFNQLPFRAMAATESGSHFGIVQIFLASAFAVLGVLAVKRCHALRTISL